MESLLQEVEKNFRFKSNIGKYVKVKTVDSNEHQGWLKCIDPMSGNMVLVTVDDGYLNITDITIIMGHACSECEVIQEPDDRITDFLDNILDEEKFDLFAKKRLLLAWIKKNRLPVVEREDHSLFVGKDVTISPPYGVSDCKGSNEITLTYMRRLISNLPTNID